MGLRLIGQGLNTMESNISHMSPSGEQNGMYGRSGKSNPCYGRKHTQEEKDKMSKNRVGKYKGENSTWFGKHLTDETKKKISESSKGRASPRKGVTLSDETKQKCRIAKLGRYIGDDNPNYRGGKSYEPYCEHFNATFRKRVRAFFGKCVVCGATEKENKRSLSVHHVHYNRDACCSDDRKVFVCLCQRCHAKTLYNKDRWEQYFITLVQEIYDNKCYLTNEEYIEKIKEGTVRI